MKSHLRKFLSRFRKSPYDPRHTRTSAQSQIEDQQTQASEPEEWKVFDEKSFERKQNDLHHHAEEDTKIHH